MEKGVIQIIKEWKGIEKLFGWIGLAAMIIVWLCGTGLSIWFCLTCK